MSNDKLNLTARAAGFAMAWDDTAEAPAPRPAGPTVPTVLLARPDAAPSRATALVPVKASKPSLGWGLMGWSFVKTA